MTKFPALGKVKTRLIPAIGQQGAYDLHQLMAEHIHDKAKHFVSQERLSHRLITHISGCSIHEAETWLGPGEYALQVEGNLGQKMQYAVNSSFEMGAEQVIVIGTDCPTLSSETIEPALTSLCSHDLVYIPATDGGYVLIGLSGKHLSVFNHITWGTDRVLQQSLHQAKLQGLNVALLPPMSDVDTKEDLEHAYHYFSTDSA